MPTIAITLNLSCCRCKSKIQKILCSLQERCGLVFEKVVYEKDKVLVTGRPFDAVDLCCKLRCKAGCFAGNIEIVPPPPPPPEKPKPVPCEKPIPIPYPYPYTYPQPCPSSCPTPPPPRPCCECHSCKPPPPKPVCPEPPKPVCPPPPPPPVCCPPSPPPCPPPVCGGGRCPTWPTPGHCRAYPPEYFCEDPTAPALSCNVTDYMPTAASAAGRAGRLLACCKLIKDHHAPMYHTYAYVSLHTGEY